MTSVDDLLPVPQRETPVCFEFSVGCPCTVSSKSDTFENEMVLFWQLHQDSGLKWGIWLPSFIETVCLQLEGNLQGHCFLWRLLVRGGLLVDEGPFVSSSVFALFSDIKNNPVPFSAPSTSFSVRGWASQDVCLSHYCIVLSSRDPADNSAGPRPKVQDQHPGIVWGVR